MTKLTITAPEGQKLTVRMQVKTARLPTEAGFDSAGNLLPVQATVHWIDNGVFSFASEAREFDLDATKRLIIDGA